MQMRQLTRCRYRLSVKLYIINCCLKHVIPNAARVCVDIDGSCYNIRVVDTRVLGVHLKTYWCLGTMSPLGPCLTGQSAMPTRVTMTPGPGLLLRTVCGPLALLKPKSELMSVTHVVTKCHADFQDLGLYLWPY